MKSKKMPAWQRRMEKAKAEFEAFMPELETEAYRSTVGKSLEDVADQIGIFLQVIGSQHERYFRQGYITVRGFVDGNKTEIDILPDGFINDTIADRHIVCHSIDEFFSQFDKMIKP